MKNKKKMCFGVIIGTRAYFNSELAKDVRKQLLETLTKEGYDYVILPEDATPTGSSSIETREDGLKCAKLFRENRDRIDGIIVSLPNFGFEIGIINAISVADLNVPVLVQACDDENDKVDLDSRRDAFCGKISVCNNLYQYGIPFTDTTLHTYSIYSDLLAADINKFAAICRVVNGLRHARIGAIGTRPAGFQTVRASEKLLQASGITVVPVSPILSNMAKSFPIKSIAGKRRIVAISTFFIFFISLSYLRGKLKQYFAENRPKYPKKKKREHFYKKGLMKLCSCNKFISPCNNFANTCNIKFRPQPNS